MNDKKQVKVIETKIWWVNEEDLEALLESGITDRFKLDLEDSTLTVSFKEDKKE